MSFYYDVVEETSMFVWGELKRGVPNSVRFCIGDLPMYIFLIPTHPYLKHKPLASFLDDSFTIFSNKYAVTEPVTLRIEFCFYMSDNFACVGCDIQRCPFTLSYRKPVHRGY